LALFATSVAGTFIAVTSSKATTISGSFPFASVSTTYCDAGAGNIFNPFAFNCPQQAPGSSAVKNLEAQTEDGIATLHVSAANNPFGPVALVEGRTSTTFDSGGFATSAGAEVDYQALIQSVLHRLTDGHHQRVRFPGYAVCIKGVRGRGRVWQRPFRGASGPGARNRR
jgi:hypothetical protein